MMKPSLAAAFGSRIGEVVRSGDWLVSVVAVLLTGIGLIAVWSYSPPGADFFVRQLLWVGVGVGAFLIFASLDYRLFRNHGVLLVILYGGALVMLAALLFFAPTTRGVRGWFYIGSAGVQPVEVMKLILVLVLAKYFSRRHIEIARTRHLLISGIYAGLAILLVFLQPDLGSALILGAVWLSMVLFAGIRFRHLFFVSLLGVAVAGIAWVSLLAPYQKERITAFLDPYRDPRGAGYNTIQAMIATGSGRIFGKGIGYGTQSQLNFLPEPETDFIFAAFAEETGFIGATLLLGLFAALIWRVLRVGRRAQDNFSKLFVVGFASFLGAEVFIHVAINLGLLPVTGIGLPLISYGGSSMITVLAALGIIQSIRINAGFEVG